MEVQTDMEGKIAVFIGAENIRSPLGLGIQENFANAKNGKTGLKHLVEPFSGVSGLFAAKFEESSFFSTSPIQEFADDCCRGSLGQLHLKNRPEERWLFVLSTTKADIDQLKSGNPEFANPYYLMKELRRKLPFSSRGIVVSCACISGLSAVIYAADKIVAGQADHAIIVGADLLSEFTVKGFESFFALDSGQCKPFDSNRRGLNLGEAAASLVLSKDKNIFNNDPLNYLSGATANDSNHISGPSRTGEGLYRVVAKALKYSGREREQIGFISAHGTGTLFNDAMEAQAFTRLGMHDVPLNSLKGYFGHTLGACGIVEMAMTMQSLRQNVLLKTLGCENPASDTPLAILTENTEMEVKVALKTSSGFGGCNAAVLIEKL